MDATVTALLVGLAGVGGTLFGVFLQYLLDGKRRLEERTWLDERDTRARVREWNITRIEETRRQLIAFNDGFAAILDRDNRRATALVEQTRGYLLANAALLGEMDAVKAQIGALTGIMEKIPAGWLRTRMTLALAWPFDKSDRERLDQARLLMLTALERQQDRALRDQPLVLLEPDDMKRELDIAGVEAEMERLSLR